MNMKSGMNERKKNNKQLWKSDPFLIFKERIGMEYRHAMGYGFNGWKIRNMDVRVLRKFWNSIATDM
jgi:hypothetical protein